VDFNAAASAAVLLLAILLLAYRVVKVLRRR